MSHYSLLVVGENVDERLAPYQENNHGTVPDEYLEWKDKEGEYRENWEKGSVEVYEINDEYVLPWNAKNVDDDKELVEVSFKELFEDFKEFAKEWYNSEGEHGYYHNPNAKWDWYEIGGRWKDSLLVKENVENVSKGDPGLGYKELEAPEEYKWVDQALVKDVEWDKMKEYSKKRSEELWEEAQEVDEDARSFKYGITEDMTKEEYVNDYNDFTTFAILDEGWKEKGNMMMFGMVANEDESWPEQYQKYLDELDDEEIITFVDCHI